MTSEEDIDELMEGMFRDEVGRYNDHTGNSVVDASDCEGSDGD